MFCQYNLTYVKLLGSRFFFSPHILILCRCVPMYSASVASGNSLSLFLFYSFWNLLFNKANMACRRNRHVDMKSDLIFSACFRRPVHTLKMALLCCLCVCQNLFSKMLHRINILVGWNIHKCWMKAKSIHHANAKATTKWRYNRLLSFTLALAPCVGVCMHAYIFMIEWYFFITFSLLYTFFWLNPYNHSGVVTPYVDKGLHSTHTHSHSFAFFSLFPLS